MIFLPPPPTAKGPVLATGPILAPVNPPNVGRRFRDAVEGVAKATQARRWDVAGKRLAELPKRRIAISYDERGVPTASREAFRNAARAGVNGFRAGFPYEVVFVPPSKPADIAFSYAKNLDDGLAIVERSGAAFDAVLGLRRGANRSATTVHDIHNDVVFAIGTYFGLAPAALPGTVMHRSAEPTAAPFRVRPLDLLAVRRNMATRETFEKAIREKRLVFAPRAIATISKDATDAGRMIEGDRAPFTIQLSNRGDGPLSYRTEADCGCVFDGGEGVVPPGGSVLLKPLLDTTGYAGPIEKRFVIYTSDPEAGPDTTLLRADVAPRQTWTGPEALVLPLEGGGRFEYRLEIAENAGYLPKEARFDGARATVETIKESDRVYRFVIDLPGTDVPAGRSFGGLTVMTDDPKRPIVRRAFAIQRGIATNPSEIYLGVLTPEDRSVRIKALRPGSPFRILSVTSPDPRVSVAVPKTSAAQHELTVKIKGGSRGDIDGPIVLKTDDPAQPELRVRIRGLGG